jgi:hypothetical protein
VKLTSVIEGIGIGAALMYFLDPDRGRSRRARIQDQAQCALRKKRAAYGVMTRDVSNRVEGLRHEMEARLHPDDAPDEIVQERVRAAIGHVCRHPSAIEVRAVEGSVLLLGDIRSTEVQNVVRTASLTRGVRRVENQLTVHPADEDVPSLQGDSAPSPERWNPTIATGWAVAGTIMTLYGLGKRGLFGSLIGSTGLGIVAKAFSDVESRTGG